MTNTIERLRGVITAAHVFYSHAATGENPRSHYQCTCGRWGKTGQAYGGSADESELARTLHAAHVAALLDGTP